MNRVFLLWVPELFYLITTLACLVHTFGQKSEIGNIFKVIIIFNYRFSKKLIHCFNKAAISVIVLLRLLHIIAELFMYLFIYLLIHQTE